MQHCPCCARAQMISGQLIESPSCDLSAGRFCFTENKKGEYRHEKKQNFHRLYRRHRV